MSFFENTRKPVGLGGKIMVALMNLGHSPVARWGLRFLELTPDAKVLDCGCGGGANIKKAAEDVPAGRSCGGIDYSPVSVEKATKAQHSSRNSARGRCDVLCARQRGADASFANRIAVRCWSRPLKPSTSGPICRGASARSDRVLKPGGTLLICNESNGARQTDKDKKWTEIIGGHDHLQGRRAEGVSGAGRAFTMCRYTKRKAGSALRRGNEGAKS